MARTRIPETDVGILGAATVETYDQMQRGLRDKGLLETNEVVANGLTRGRVLELGPGPGYLGLEWLKSTQGTLLEGLDISPDMIERARCNAREYNLQDRAESAGSACLNRFPRTISGVLPVLSGCVLPRVGCDGGRA
jgi:methylase of polypeptide subunit release factors